MKKNVIIYSLISVIASFFLMFDLFNNVSTGRITSYQGYYLLNGYESTMIQIELTYNLSSISSSLFSKSLNKYAKDNNLVISRYLFTDSDNGKSVFRLYLSDNDLFINKRILLKKGYASGISKDVVYSTNSINDSTKILLFDLFERNSVYEVTSIENYPYKNGAFVLTNIDGDIKSNLNNFINDLSNEFGEISYKNDTSLLGKEFYSDLKIAGNLFNDILIKLSVCLLITTNFIIHILMIKKRIVMLKLEGHSIFQIYNDIFLKTYISYLLFFYFLFSIILYLIYGSNIYSFKNILILFSIQLIQILFIQISFSSVYYLIIKNIEFAKSADSYKKLNVIFYIVLICKVIILIIFIPYIKTSFTNIIEFNNISSRYEDVMNKLNNYYYFSFIKNSNYVVGSNEAINIRDQFVEDANLFEEVHSQFYNFETQETYGDYYVFDENYIKNSNLPFANNDEVYIYLRKNVDYDLDFLKEEALSFMNEYTNINFIYYDFDIETFIPDELLYSDYINNYPIFYVPEYKGYEAILDLKYFYFNGDILECQDYIDNVFISNGFSPLYGVSNLGSDYNAAYSYKIKEIKNGLIIFTLLLVSYLYLNLLLIKIDISNNQRKYYLKYCEGENIYSIFNFFKLFSIPCILSLIISIFIYSLTLSDILYSIIVLLVIEILHYLIFHIRGGRHYD